MVTSDSKRQMLGRFISALFAVGDEPDRPRGIWGQSRGDATPADLISFVQNQEVLDVTEKYLNEILGLWKRSNRGRVSLNPPTEQPPAARLETFVENDTEKKHLQTALTDTKDFNMATQPQKSVSDLSAIKAKVMDALPATFPPALPTLLAAPIQKAVQPSGSAQINNGIQPGQMPPIGAQAGKPVEPRAVFHLPNAKAGLPYSGVLDGKDPTGKPVSIVDVKFPEGIGLQFEAASNTVSGIPTVSGDHKIAIKWSPDGRATHSAEYVFVVNPDPKSLWKKIDPPNDDPYFKESTDSKRLVCPRYSLLAASRRGRSHEHAGTFRDDDFFIHHDPKSEWSVMIVADGAGSAKSSRWGSKLAVKAFGEHVLGQLQGDFGGRMTGALAGWGANPQATAKTLGTEFHYLFHKAGTLAVQAIESEAQTKGVPVKEYSTTLLAVATRYDGSDIFLATFWMGDGAIAAYGPRGKVRLMGTPDGGEFAGQTRFLDRNALADQSFAKRIGIGRYPDLTAVLLMTDGVSDPRFETDNGLANAALWDALWDEIKLMVEAPDADKKLVEWLDFFSPGHHDDRTIAVLT
jgi:hypothetical protein